MKNPDATAQKAVQPGVGSREHRAPPTGSSWPAPPAGSIKQGEHERRLRQIERLPISRLGSSLPCRSANRTNGLFANASGYFPFPQSVRGFAGLAQMAEQRICNAHVASSILAASTRLSLPSLLPAALHRQRHSDENRPQAEYRSTCALADFFWS